MYVVGIGASAGGLDAIERLFDNMPAKTGMAFVLIQHLSPDFKSLMDELLSRHTSMPVIRVERTTSLAPDTVFLIPPRRNLILTGELLELVNQDHSSGANLPIDRFFSSMAESCGSNCAAIVLSGTGRDGSRGILRVKEAGGIVLAQTPDSAAFDGMPRSAMATQCVEIVARPEDMPARLLEYLQSPRDFVGDTDRDEHGPAGTDLEMLFRLFRQRYRLDFSQYKPGTVERRVERRVQLTRAASLTEYLRMVEADETECSALFRDLLVEVTQFFRDPEAFDRLRTHYIPEVLSNATPDEPVRVWAPGCATGEEAYSLAILFHAAMQERKMTQQLRVFASDVHSESLEAASVGVFSPEAVMKMPEPFRSSYFSRYGSLFHIAPEIRRSILFVNHDLIKDPPFTRVDLISCRNVMIYLRPEIQRRILGLFHFGLRLGGVLFLGPSETIRPMEEEFTVLDSRWKIFRKRRESRLNVVSGTPLSAPTSETRVLRHTSSVAVPVVARRADSSVALNLFHNILSKHLPPSLLANSRGDLVYSFGNARRFLQQPEGNATTSVVRMLTGELRSAVAAGLHQLTLNSTPLSFPRVHATAAGEPLLLNVTLEAFLEGEDRYVLVRLEDAQDNGNQPGAPVTTAAVAPPNIRYGEIERELDTMRDSLQATIEELETSNEELQATNEELVASNEELQSVNEELHSVNEELHTVNSEHQSKIEELIQLNADLNHLLKVTGIAILYLDRHLAIRRFTAGVRIAFNVLDQDLGRPIEHISHNLVDPMFIQRIREVMESGEAREIAETTVRGEPVLVNILPYEGPGKQVDGVLITISNGHSVHEAQEVARRIAQQRDRSDVELINFAYAVSHDLQSGLRHLNDGVRELLKQSVVQDSSPALTSVDLIKKSSTRLNEMIEGLLAYSRIHTRNAPLELVRLDTVLDLALARLVERHPMRDVELVREPLPTLLGEPHQLETVFFQLIDNAIKYRSQRPLRIQIRGMTVGMSVVITIQDNGIGIDARNLSRIFIIFQRLHRDVEVPGLGLGLPMSRRIIERHGGTLTVESTLGQGSVFKITLPVHQNTEGVQPLVISPPGEKTAEGGGGGNGVERSKQ